MVAADVMPGEGREGEAGAGMVVRTGCGEVAVSTMRIPRAHEHFIAITFPGNDSGNTVFGFIFPPMRPPVSPGKILSFLYFTEEIYSLI